MAKIAFSTVSYTATNPSDILTYSNVILSVATLIMLALAIGAAYVAIVRSRKLGYSARQVAVGGRLHPSDGLAATIEKSEALTLMASSSDFDPVVHLRGALRVTPTDFSDTAKEVFDAVNAKCVVILDLATVDESLALRLVDFCSGLMVGSRGWFYRVSSTTVLLTPCTE